MLKLSSFPVVTAAAIVLVIVGAVVTVAALTLTARGGTQDIALEGVPGQALTNSGIRLAAPPAGHTPAITAEEAVAVATTSDGRRHAAILETKLVRLVQQLPDVQAEPFADNLAWVVSFDPATVSVLPPLGPSARDLCPRPLYAIAFIDAETGESIFELERSKTEECPDSTSPPDFTSPTQAPTQVPGAETASP